MKTIWLLREWPRERPEGRRARAFPTLDAVLRTAEDELGIHPTEWDGPIPGDQRWTIEHGPNEGLAVIEPIEFVA